MTFAVAENRNCLLTLECFVSLRSYFEFSAHYVYNMRFKTYYICTLFVILSKYIYQINNGCLCVSNTVSQAKKGQLSATSAEEVTMLDQVLFPQARGLV